MADAEDQLDEALKHLRHNPERSLEICEQYLSEHPDDPNGLFSRHQALETLGEDERALADITRVVELEPSWAAYSSRGQLLRKMGRHQQAIDDLTHSLELDEWVWKTSYDPHFRADSYARLGRLEEALADCEFIAEDHWMPGVLGLPRGNKQEFIEEIKRRAARARGGKTQA